MRGTVVIPAHDESAVIGRCLSRLLDGVDPVDLDIIVVANGCSDDTAEIARRFPVTVIEMGAASKARALNVGDALATALPRAYIDADVEILGSDVLAVLDHLSSTRALAAAPTYEFDTTACPWPIRAYYAVWTELPYAVDRPLGSGFYAVSAGGRARFERFPDAIADDLFIRSLFTRDERASVEGTVVRVSTARRVGALVERCTRVFVGNAELAARDLVGTAAPPAGRTVLVDVVRARPSLALSLPAYLAITAVAKLRARRRLRSGDRSWGRDETSRRGPAVTDQEAP